MTQSWKLRVPTFFFPNFGVNTCPQFWDKNNFISKFLFICSPCCDCSFENIRVTPDFSGRILYNTPIVPFSNLLDLLTFPFSFEQALTVQTTTTKALTLTDLLLCQTVVLATFLQPSSDSDPFQLQWRPATMFLRYVFRFMSFKC